VLRAAVVLCALAFAGCASDGAQREVGATSATTPATKATSEPEREVAPPHPPARPRSSRGAIRKLTAKHARVSRSLTDAARELMTVDPSVVCWDKPGWRRLTVLTNRELPPGQRGEFDGLADLFTYEILLAPWVCEPLEALPKRPVDDLELAAALGVLAHETRHLTSAGSNEAAAECAGLQKITAVAVALGLDERTGQRLARRNWRELYPLLPAEYYSPECKPGGGLDGEPQTPAFP
jgi:hypothetical protein